MKGVASDDGFFISRPRALHNFFLRKACSLPSGATIAPLPPLYDPLKKIAPSSLSERNQNWQASCVINYGHDPKI
jgi:hypothetical protein